MKVISMFLPLDAAISKHLLSLRVSAFLVAEATAGRVAISLLFQPYGIASVVSLPRNDIFISSKD